jgi:hypothetical protein
MGAVLGVRLQFPRSQTLEPREHAAEFGSAAQFQRAQRSNWRRRDQGKKMNLIHVFVAVY